MTTLQTRVLTVTFGRGIGDNSACEIPQLVELTGYDLSDDNIRKATKIREASLGMRLDELMSEMDELTLDLDTWEAIVEAGFEPRVPARYKPYFEVEGPEDEGDDPQVDWTDFALWWTCGSIPGFSWKFVDRQPELFSITGHSTVARAYAIEHVG